MKNLFRTLVVIFSLCPLWATDRYISPSGSGSDCSFGTPCAWSTARAASSPGDSIILTTGTYTSSFEINCNSNANDGTSANPITITSAVERRGYIDGDGTFVPLNMLNCSYWKIIGLRANSDDQNGGAGSVFTFYNSDHIQISRNLVVHPNRYVNDHCISVYGGGNNYLIEENEAYECFRHGIALQQDITDSVVRRNYCNSRSMDDIGGGYPSDPTDRGDACFILYPGSRIIVENNIAEDTGIGFDVEAPSTAIDNKFYGNIAIDVNYGLRATAREVADINHIPRNSIVQNLLVIDPFYYGIYARSTKNTQATGVSVFSTASGGVAADENSDPADQGDGNPTAFFTNVLVTPTGGGYDYYFLGQSDYVCNYCAVTGSVTPALSDAKITNEFTSAPTNLSTCYIRIPDASNLKGAGLGGADIGAAVVYRYQNGTLTGTPLWDTVTGAFPAGDVIAGVNSNAANSLSGVHDRLNVMDPGCLPTGYGGPPASITVTTPIVGSRERLPNTTSLSWSVNNISSGVMDAVTYSFDGFVTSYAISACSGVAWNATPCVFTPTWPAQSSMQVKVCQGATCGTSPAFSTGGAYLRLR